MTTSPNLQVQATAVARFRFLALVVFIQSSGRSHPSPAAVPDLWRSAIPQHERRLLWLPYN